MRDGHPDELDRSTSVLLSRLAQYGLLAEGDAAILLKAARFYLGLMQMLWLCFGESFNAATAPEELKIMLYCGAGAPDFSAVEAMLAESQGAVAICFNRLVA